MSSQHPDQRDHAGDVPSADCELGYRHRPEPLPPPRAELRGTEMVGIVLVLFGLVLLTIWLVRFLIQAGDPAGTPQ